MNTRSARDIAEITAQQIFRMEHYVCPKCGTTVNEDPADVVRIIEQALEHYHREQLGFLAKMEDAGWITLDPDEQEECCGLPRDHKGRCVHRDHHPIAIKALFEWFRP